MPLKGTKNKKVTIKYLQTDDESDFFKSIQYNEDVGRHTCITNVVIEELEENEPDKMDSKLFKKELLKLLEKYNNDQGHVVKSIDLNSNIEQIGHIKKLLWYDLELEIT